MTALPGIADKRRVIPPALHEQYAAIQAETETHLPRDLAGIVADFAVDHLSFGRYEWNKYFGIDVGKEPSRVEMDAWLDAPDPERPELTRRQTHTIPVLCPESIYTDPKDVESIDSIPLKQDFNLGTLQRLAAHPREGAPVKIPDTEASRLYANRPPGRTCWVVYRIDENGDTVLGRRERWERQRPILAQLNEQTRGGYEINPSAIDAAKVAIAIHRSMGLRYFGDHTGEEGRLTLARGREMFTYPNTKDSFHLDFGNFALRFAIVSKHTSDDYIGVPACRKFY